MNHFTMDELALIAIYNTGYRQTTLAELQEVWRYLNSENECQTDLIEALESVIFRLHSMTDEAFRQLDLQEVY